MGLVETAIVYGALGITVAGAMALRDPRRSGLRLAGQLALGLLFWPLFAPTVLAGGGGGERRAAPPSTFGPRIRAAEERLMAAIARVDGGVAAQALAPELARIRSLGASLERMSARHAEIEELLASPEFDEAGAREALRSVAARAHGDDDARVLSIQTRLANIERLRAMRARTGDELERALLKMEEIASQMLLLKFAGKPETEVVGLVKDVADSVQSITEALLETD